MSSKCFTSRLCWTKPYMALKKWNDDQTKIAFVYTSHEFLASDPTCFSFSSTSSWWEEPVEIEWQCVELFVSVISPESSKLHPPWHPPVFLRPLNLQGVVKEHRHNQPHCCW